MIAGSDPASCCVSVYWFYLVQHATARLLILKKLIGLLTRLNKHILLKGYHYFIFVSLTIPLERLKLTAKYFSVYPYPYA